MLGIQNFWLFVASGILLNLTPGQDTMYIVGRGIYQGRRAAIISVLGISSGAVVHTLAAAFGLSAILAASAEAFTVLKWAGAAYLAYLGIRLLLSSGSALSGPQRVAMADEWTIYRQAVLTNVLNPKVALFFLAFIPQFIRPDAPSRVLAFLVLGGCFLFTGTCWCMVLALASGSAARFLQRRPGAARWGNRVAGGMFILLGVRLALSRQ